MTAAAKLRDQGDIQDPSKSAMKFYRQFVDEDKPEEITEEAFRERYKDDFKDVQGFIDFLKGSSSKDKKYPFHGALYWFEQGDE